MNRLSRLGLKGFKSIREMDLELGPLNVLIGPNGAGKSNLLSFFQMLGALSQGRLARFIGQEGGANMILHHGRKRTPEIEAKVSFDDGQRGITYSVTLGGAAPDTFFLDREEIEFSPGSAPTTTHAYGGKKVISLSAFSQPHGREEEEILARLVGGLTHYHFHDTSKEAPIRLGGPVDDNRALQDNGATSRPSSRSRDAGELAHGVHARRAMGEERPRGPPVKRVLLLAEGPTEEAFVKRVLAPHLWTVGVALEVTCVATRRVQSRRAFRGGMPSYAKVEGDVRRLLASSPDAVTTLFDYYALQGDFPGQKTLPSGASCFERARHIEKAFAREIDDPRFIPNLVLHEFEGLLFAEPGAIAGALLDLA